MSARALSLFLGVGVLAALAQPARAYVREVTNSGVPVAWRYPCITMQIYLGSPPPVLTAAEYFDASTQAASVWSYPTLTCTDIRLTMVAAAEAASDVGRDDKNVIVFRQDTWCRQPTPVDDAGVPQPECYPSSALAVTSLFKNAKTGEILDADIEFNAVDYSWGDLVTQPSPANVDFQNALTHELGHVIGLDHNCYAPNDAQPRHNDNTGAPEVDCYGNPQLPDSVALATMYPSVLTTDTLRRDLSQDDQQGICEVYPHLHDVCPSPPSDSGCSVLAVPRPERNQTALLWSVLAAAFAVLMYLHWRRKV